MEVWTSYSIVRVSACAPSVVWTWVSPSSNFIRRRVRDMRSSYKEPSSPSGVVRLRSKEF